MRGSLRCFTSIIYFATWSSLVCLSFQKEFNVAFLFRIRSNIKMSILDNLCHIVKSFVHKFVKIIVPFVQNELLNEATIL